MNKKIVLFIDSLVSGGAQRQILMLARELSGSGFDITLLVYHDINELSYMIDEDIQYICVPKKTLSLFGFFTGIYRVFRRTQPSAIIAYLHQPSLLARILGRLAGVKKIITSERNLDLDKSISRYLLELMTYPLSTKIVTNAHCTRDRLIKLLPASRKKIEVIYNAVDTIAYSAITADEKREARLQYGIPVDVFVFLLPGRIVEQKNHLALISAAKKISPDIDFRLVFVGNEIDLDIKHKMQVSAESTRLESRLIFLGQQKNMREIYGLSDCVVLPSLWEGLPNVVIEAMACERPVIASDVSDNAAILDASSGYIFACDDISALVISMDDIMASTNHQQNAMGASGRSIIKKICSKEVFTEKYISLIK